MSHWVIKSFYDRDFRAKIYSSVSEMDSNKSNGKERKKHKKCLGELKIIKNISAKMKKQDEENSSYFGKK